MYPASTNTHDLGSSTYKWRNVYASAFYGSGASLTNLPAEQLTGTVDAARLPAATTTTQGALSATDKAKLDSLETITAITNNEIDAICGQTLTMISEVSW
jgi:hypothetical protein